jgi:hypothetical protein
MSLRIGYLPNSVFAIIVLGMINATASKIAKDPHTVSDHFSKARETALSLPAPGNSLGQVAAWIWRMETTTTTNERHR